MVTKENSPWLGCLMFVDEINDTALGGQLKGHMKVPGGGKIPYTVNAGEVKLVGRV